MPRTQVRLFVGLLLVGVLLAACGDDAATEIVFEDETCSMTGASGLEPGAREFVFTNNASQEVWMYVRRLADGHTHEELGALHDEYGGPGANFPRPTWMLTVEQHEAESAMELDDNQWISTYILTPGEYVPVLWTPAPEGIWLCPSFAVLDS